VIFLDIPFMNHERPYLACNGVRTLSPPPAAAADLLLLSGLRVCGRNLMPNGE
jgi:hypothetical protein